MASRFPGRQVPCVPLGPAVRGCSVGPAYFEDLKWKGDDLCLGKRVVASVDQTGPGFRVRMPEVAYQIGPTSPGYVTPPIRWRWQT